MLNSDLVNLLEGAAIKRYSGVLEAYSSNQQSHGNIAFLRGTIVYAKRENFSGRQALFSMLMQHGDSFQWTAAEVPEQVNCNMRVDQVLYDFAQLVDQYQSSEEEMTEHIYRASTPSWKQKRRTVRLQDLNLYSVSLMIHSDDFEEKEIELKSGTYTIGKSDKADIQIFEPSISRMHCIISVTQKAITLSDLRSTNGTYINDEFIEEEEMVFPGDSIRLGSLELSLEASLNRHLDIEMAKPSPIKRVARTIDIKKAIRKAPQTHKIADSSQPSDKSLIGRLMGKKK